MDSLEYQSYINSLDDPMEYEVNILIPDDLNFTGIRGFNSHDNINVRDGYYDLENGDQIEIHNVSSGALFIRSSPKIIKELHLYDISAIYNNVNTILVINKLILHISDPFFETCRSSLVSRYRSSRGYPHSDYKKYTFTDVEIYPLQIVKYYEGFLHK